MYGVSNDAVAVMQWQQGKLTPLQKVETGMRATSVCFHPELRLLYVAGGKSRKNKTAANGRVFKVAKDGRISLKATFSFPYGYAQLKLDKSGKYLIGASYSTGYTNVFRLDAEGMPQETESVFEGKNKAHAVAISPDNKYVYIPFPTARIPHSGVLIVRLRLRRRKLRMSTKQRFSTT